MNKYNVRFHEEDPWSNTGTSPTGHTVVQKPGKGQVANKGIDLGISCWRSTVGSCGEHLLIMLQTLKRAGRPVDMVFAMLVNAETRMNTLDRRNPYTLRPWAAR